MYFILNSKNFVIAYYNPYAITINFGIRHAALYEQNKNKIFSFQKVLTN